MIIDILFYGFVIILLVIAIREYCLNDRELRELRRTRTKGE